MRVGARNSHKLGKSVWRGKKNRSGSCRNFVGDLSILYIALTSKIISWSAILVGCLYVRHVNFSLKLDFSSTWFQKTKKRAPAKLVKVAVSTLIRLKSNCSSVHIWVPLVLRAMNISWPERKFKNRNKMRNNIR